MVFLKIKNAKVNLTLTTPTCAPIAVANNAIKMLPVVFTKPFAH